MTSSTAYISSLGSGEIQRHLDRLKQQSNSNFYMPLTLWLRAGYQYDLESPIRIPSHISLRTDHIARLNYIGPPTRDPIVYLEGGYNSRLTGFQIRSADPTPNLTGVETNIDCIDPRIEDCSVTLEGNNTRGFVIAGEAAKLQNIKAVSDMPLLYNGRDNHVYTNTYLICTSSISTPFTLLKNPNQVTIEGSNRWAKGKGAIYGDFESVAVGQNLNIRNLRYEQSENTPNDWAIDITCRNGAFAELQLDGCYSDKRRELGTRIRYNSDRPRKPRYTTPGTEWPGKVSVEPL